MNIDIAAADLATSTAYSFTDSQDFASSNSFEGVDVNSSSLSYCRKNGHGILNQVTLDQSATLSGVSNWYVQSSNVIGGSQTGASGFNKC